MVLLSWCQLTQDVLEKRLLNGLVVVVVVVVVTSFNQVWHLASIKSSPAISQIFKKIVQELSQTCGDHINNAG